jgi:hypothetical protein
MWQLGGGSRGGGSGIEDIGATRNTGNMSPFCYHVNIAVFSAIDNVNNVTSWQLVLDKKYRSRDWKPMTCKNFPLFIFFPFLPNNQNLLRPRTYRPAAFTKFIKHERYPMLYRNFPFGLRTLFSSVLFVLSVPILSFRKRSGWKEARFNCDEVSCALPFYNRH